MSRLATAARPPTSNEYSRPQCDGRDRPVSGSQTRTRSASTRLLWQIHLPQKRFVARIVFEIRRPRVGLYVLKIVIPLRIRFFHPAKRCVAVSTVCIRARELERKRVAGGALGSAHCGVRFGVTP